MKFEDVMKKTYFREIIRLLEKYQNRKNGLRPIHFRYALMENHELCSDSLREVELFFGNDLKEYYLDDSNRKKLRDIYEKSGKQFDDRYFLRYPVFKCINSQQKLINYLTTLFDMRIVSKKGKQPNVRYKLKQKYYAELKKRNIISNIDIWGYSNIQDKRFLINYLNKKTEEENIKDALSLDNTLNWVLFGLPKKLLIKLSDKEKKELLEWLNEIEKYLYKIIELKYSKMKMQQEVYLKNRIKGKKVDSPILSNIDFFFHSYKNILYPTISEKK